MKKFLILTQIIFMIASCTNSKSNLGNENNSVTVHLPYKIRTNEELKGLIEYKSDFDSITTSYTDTTNFKTPWFYVYEPQEDEIDMNNLVIKDSIRLWSTKININNFRFSKKGTYYFLGMIKDGIMLFSYKENGKTDSIRMITNEYFISQKIYVTD